MNFKNIAKISWLLSIIIILSSCQPGILQPPTDEYGCRMPKEIVTLTRHGGSLEGLSVRDIAAGKIDLYSHPEYQILLSEAARSQLVCDYLICRAIKAGEIEQDNFGQIQFLRAFYSFVATTPTPEQFMEWQESNPFPSNGIVSGKKPLYPRGQNINQQGTSVSGSPRDTELKLIFKDSPLFTPERKKRISTEINAFKNYLAGLGFEIPNEAPQFGISETPPPPFNISSGRTYRHTFMGPPCGKATQHSISGGANFLEDITIIDKDIDNLAMWRRAYAEHVFWRIFRCSNLENEFWTGIVSVFVNYLAGSYANQRPQNIEGEKDLIINTLWDIRDNCNQDFTDRALFHTSKVKFQEGEDFDKCFLDCFSRGLAVVDNGFHNVPKINEILYKYDLPWVLVPFWPGGIRPVNDIKSYNEAFGRYLTQ